jgi:hypothetical protein
MSDNGHQVIDKPAKESPYTSYRQGGGALPHRSDFCATPSKLLTCSICHRRFTTKLALQGHMGKKGHRQYLRERKLTTEAQRAQREDERLKTADERPGGPESDRSDG